MLSLIELQNKKVEAKRKKYEKDEMDAYLELVFDNYKQLTEENAKLTEQLRNKEREMQAERDDLNSKIKTLSDGVQYYRSIETTLQKALILAEKTSKETKDAAILKAESIEKAAHLHADKIINNAEEEYQKIREKSMQLIQQFNQYKLQLKEAASAQLQLVEGSEFDIHKPEDLDSSKAAGEETVSTQEKPEGTVKDSRADTKAESTPAEEKDNEITVAAEPVKAEEKQIAPKTTEMSEEDRTAEILSADTIDLRDTLEAVKEQEPEIPPQEQQEKTQPEVPAEEAAETVKEEAKEEKETVKIPEESVKTVTEAAVTTPVNATPVKPIDVTFTSMDDELEEKEQPKTVDQLEPEDKVAKNEDLVPTLDSLLQDLNMNNKEKKTDDPFEFLGSVDF
ncbi:MAG: DivIVA domain-containing protein [Eubacterium sp.]|nr:DivIVA domain-containing protein [Eubacterium sp.]